MDPVEILLEQHHAFKKKRPDPDTGRRRVGCEVCGEAHWHADHLGAPPSLNEGGSGMDRHAFQAMKKAWQTAIRDALNETTLPRGLAQVMVEGQVGFPDRRERDEGNHRWMIEKACGDALVQGGYLDSDSFYPERRYSFGGLQGVHDPKRSWTRLLVMPVGRVAPQPVQGVIKPAQLAITL